jgi:hypothetical protein
LYAKLFKILMEEYEVFKKIFEDNYKVFMNLFDNIEYIDPKKNMISSVNTQKRMIIVVR